MRWILALLLVPWLARADVEARCTELGLGSGCVCSETLNVNDNVASSPNGVWNFSNSSVAEECGDCDNGVVVQCQGAGNSAYMSVRWQTDSAMVRASSTALGAFPSGADPWVYQGGFQFDQFIFGDDWLAVSNETICDRSYRGFSPGVPSFLNPQEGRLKEQQIVFLPFDHIDLQHATCCSGGLTDDAHISWEFPSWGVTGPGIIPDYYTKCKQGWCRLEICADQNGPANTLKFRVRVTFLKDNPATEATDSSPTGSGGSPPLTMTGWVQMYGEGAVAAAGVAGARQYVSHFMQTRVPYDPTFWPGPAYELEGGGGGPPPPLPHGISGAGFAWLDQILETVQGHSRAAVLR